MPNLTVSDDIDALLASATKADARIALAVPSAASPTFTGLGTAERFGFAVNREIDAAITFTQVDELPESSFLTGRAIQFLQDYAAPYNVAAYVMPNGVYMTGTHIVISNKREALDGTFQSVSALADGSESSMLAVSPDINGPAVAIEADGAMGTGKADATAIAIYDLADPVGGATAWSSGYGRKRFAIGGWGQLLWGADLGVTPLASADVKLTRSGAGNLLFEGSLFQLGGITSGDPALKKVSGSLAVKLADDSNYAPVSAYNFLANDVGSFQMGSNGSVEWSNVAYTPGATKDLKLTRVDVSTMKVTDGSTGTGTIIAKLPTSSSGLEPGTLWNNGGTPAFA